MTVIPLPDALDDLPVVAILRAPSGDRLVEVSRVLIDAGIRGIEITCTTPGAIEAIGALTAGAGVGAGVAIGAGTVRTAEQARHAADVGAAFLVNMAAEQEVLDVARERGVPYIPGAMTPTEISQAWKMGVPAVKVSPVTPIGGVRYISELVGPWPDVPLFATGGVGIDHAADYLRAGARYVGVSGDLIRDALSPRGDLVALAQRAAAVVAAVAAR